LKKKDKSDDDGSIQKKEKKLGSHLDDILNSKVLKDFKDSN